MCQTLTTLLKYLVSNFDVQREKNDDEQVVKDANRCCQGRRQFQWWCRWSRVQHDGCWQDTASSNHLSTRMSWRRSRHHSTMMRSPSLLKIISVISLSNLLNDFLPEQQEQRERPQAEQINKISYSARQPLRFWVKFIHLNAQWSLTRILCFQRLYTFSRVQGLFATFCI